MRIDVRTKHVELMDKLRAHVERRVHFALSRLAPEIESVIVRVEDINGPRGGADKHVSFAVRGPRIGSLQIEETNEDELAAIDLVADRAARNVTRALQRRRTVRSADAGVRRAS